MLIFVFWFSGFFPSKRGVRGVTPSCLVRGVTPTDATWSSANFVITDVIFYVFPSSFLHSMEKISQFLIFLSILSYLWYFLMQLVFSEPNLHESIFIFIHAYSWNCGASVTCVNEGNSKSWLRHCKKKNLISLVISFIMIGWKLLYRPECFIMRGVFYN